MYPDYITPSLISRFWAKVNKAGPSDCWMWTAATSGNRYGCLGKGAPYRGLVKAHHLSYILHIGPIPTGTCVLHRCDNPLCVNPSHLFLGSQADNVRDCIEKGRFVGRSALLAARTNCKHGHPFTPDNTYTDSTGSRHCRACGREHARGYRAARKQSSPLLCADDGAI